MELKEYLIHTDRILRGLESLKTLNEANIPNFRVEGILIYDDTREAFDIVSIRELIHTFTSEFHNCTEYLKDGQGYRIEWFWILLWHVTDYDTTNLSLIGLRLWSIMLMAGYEADSSRVVKIIGDIYVFTSLYRTLNDNSGTL